jgi:hypothetical protein
MTNEEDEWLSDFLETAQAFARPSQATAEKDYGTKLKLFTPRFERARVCDAEEALAKRLAASEALAGQRKFDDASDALDEAFAIAGDLLRNAAPPVVEEVPAVEPVEEVVAETMAEGAAVGTVGEVLAEEVAGEAAPAEGGVEEAVPEPSGDEYVASDATVEEAAAEPVADEYVAPDVPVEEFVTEHPAEGYVSEEAAGEIVTEEPVGEVTTDESASGGDAEQQGTEYGSENLEEGGEETAPTDEGPGFVPTDSFSLSVGPGNEAASTEETPAEEPPPEEPEPPKKRGRS